MGWHNMDTIEKRLTELGINLPELPAPIANFKPGIITGNLLYLSGQGPVLENGKLATGKVGRDISVEEAYEHARRTGLVLISAMQQLLGNLDQVKQIVKLLGMVNATPDFTQHPKVINGCSDLLVEVFGDKGQHARSAVGMGSLPGNISVEIEAIIEIDTKRIAL
ncbi:MAG: RidA family protein [Deltaproteobacteria bacterium]|nr:MAG: RidA family protein [Deltaproteobacteria bacterium]